MKDEKASNVCAMPRPYQPSHDLLYQPGALPAPDAVPDTAALHQAVERYLPHPLNDRQEQAFQRVFAERLSLLWGPPGTGKTDTVGTVVLGRLEQAFEEGRPISIAVGSSNWNAIDNVLEKVVDYLERRRSEVGADPLPVRIIRLRSTYGDSPASDRLRQHVEDMERMSADAVALTAALEEPAEAGTCLVVGSTWQQLSKLAGGPRGAYPRRRWFDMLVLDEASQVRVAQAAGYYLLLRGDAHVLVAGDPRQLGPVYAFDLRDVGTEGGLLDSIFTYYVEGHGLQPTPLNRNYRTCEEIAAWPRVRFYNDDYEAHFAGRRLALALPTGPPPGWPADLPWSDHYLDILNPERPIVVVSYRPMAYTLANPFEAETVAALGTLFHLARLNGSVPGNGYWDDFWEERLGVVTPHRAQMAAIRNGLVDRAGFPAEPIPAVDTVDRFQGRERDCMVASYAVADKDFAAQEDAFILSARRFNVTITRARSKFVLLLSEALLQYLPADLVVAEDAAHLQRFVRAHCRTFAEVELPFDGGVLRCSLRTPEA